MLASVRAAERRASNARTEYADVKRQFTAANTAYKDALCFGMESSWQIHTGREVKRLVAVVAAAEVDMAECNADVARARLALSEYIRGG